MLSKCQCVLKVKEIDSVLGSLEFDAFSATYCVCDLVL